MLWVIISLLLLGMGVLTVLRLRSSDDEELIQSKEPIGIPKEEAPPPPPPKPKEVFYELNTHLVKRLLFPRNTFNHDSVRIYRHIIIEQGWSTDESFHNLMVYLILLFENDNLHVIPKGVRVTHGINRDTDKKYKMCKAAPLLLVVKRCVVSIAKNRNYPKNKRKEFIVSAFIILLKRAEHLFCGLVEVDETLEELLARSKYETSIDYWTNLINQEFIEDLVFYTQTCNCIFQLNRETYYLPIYKMPKKEMVSIGDYSF